MKTVKREKNTNELKLKCSFMKSKKKCSLLFFNETTAININNYN